MGKKAIVNSKTKYSGRYYTFPSQMLGFLWCVFYQANVYYIGIVTKWVTNISSFFLLSFHILPISCFQSFEILATKYICFGHIPTYVTLGSMGEWKQFFILFATHSFTSSSSDVGTGVGWGGRRATGPPNTWQTI